MPRSPRNQATRTAARRRSGPIAACCLALLLSACERTPEPSASPPLPIAPPSPPEAPLPALLPSKPALPQPMLDGVYLSARLPGETIGYLRLPNPWHLLGDLTGRSSDRAYGSSSWRSQLDQLRAAAPATARLQGWPVGLGATLGLVDSPIEILLLDTEGQLGADNRVLLSTSLSTDRIADAARLTAEWVAWISGTPPPPIAIDARGYGEADIGLGEPLRLQFQRGEQRLYLYWGEGADLDTFSQLLARLAQPVGGHRAQAEIEAADESGRGLLLWLDLAATRPLARHSTGAWRVLPDLAGSALFAAGTVRGRGQLTLALDELPDEVLARLPKTAGRIPVTTAGATRWALFAALPDRREWEALRGWLEDRPAANVAAPLTTDVSAAVAEAEGIPDGTTASSDGRQRLANPLDRLDDWLRPLIGVNAGTLLDRIGPELALWRDAAGVFTALRVRDEEGFDSLLARLNHTLDGRRAARRWNGLDVQEFSLPTLAIEHPDAAASLIQQAPAAVDTAAVADPAAVPATDTAMAPTGLWQSLRRIRSRAYWIEEAPFLVFASVPQSLVDRQSNPNKSDLDHWFDQVQGSPSAGSLFLYSASVRDLPRDSYHQMIRLLQAVGDLLEVPVDPFAFPNADEVDLPERGSLALRLGIDSRRLALTLRYQDLPSELVGEPVGLASSMALALLSTAAISAHAEHRARIFLLDVTAASTAARSAVDDFQQRRRRLPRQWQELGNQAPVLNDWLPGVSAEYEDASLQIHLADVPTVPAPLRGSHLMLRRDKDGRWHCDPQASTIPEALNGPACDSLIDPD